MITAGTTYGILFNAEYYVMSVENDFFSIKVTERN